MTDLFGRASLPLSSDPLRVVWNALDARGCRPRGKPFDFRARCPRCQDERRDALRVGIGADGRALLYCFACHGAIEEVAAALGLAVADLFPAGHRHARRRALEYVRRSDFTGVALSVANALSALEQLGEPWQLMLTSTCPCCGSPGAWLRASSRGSVLRNGFASEGCVDADCPEGCDAHAYTQALLARLEEKRKEINA